MVPSENKYLFNSKELQDEQLGGVNLDWYDFNFRMYDPALGRFTCLDPIAEKFYHVTPYNYAENSPIANIDLWGLQKVYFMKGLGKNQTFVDSYSAARSTTLGKEFMRNLESQKAYDVMFVEITQGHHDGRHKEISSLKAAKNALHPAGPYNGKDPDFSNLSIEDFENYFDNNPEKKILLMGIDVKGGSAEAGNDILETGETIVHEEQHANTYLTGERKTNAEVHKDYHGNYTTDSPNAHEIKSNPKYEGTKARKTVDELDKHIEELDK
jgi:RHS repeat-associated protein